MSLSTLELLKVVDAILVSKGYADSLEACNTFVEEVMKCGIQVPSIFSGWCGMDSRFCAAVVCISISYTKGTLVELPSFKKTVVSAVLLSVYTQYAKECGRLGLSFVPCVKGLTTILKRRKSVV